MSANNLAKSTKGKENNDNDLCKKHAPRCDKDYTRSICPSKLSKRELEDLYYTLLENNLELKRTINAQNEKNRILSTKVQRMTMQTKTYVNKECCAAGKAVINEQKATITDLTKANEALADRVRRLSTQLCTAKQFLKQNPNAKHCYKCYVNTTTSVKNLSTTSLQNKSSNVNLKSTATSAIQLLDQEPPSTRTAETNTPEDVVEKDEKGDAEKVCNENKCRSTMEQLKQKIEELEEELDKTHNEYSGRMTQLEAQVCQLQAAVRGRSEQALRARDSLELARRGLRQADVRKDELETALSIERKKISELEMRLKATEISQRIAKTVEDHLSNSRRLQEEKQLRQTSNERRSVCSNVITDDGSSQRVNTSPNKTPNQLTVPDDRQSKSDDSGYADQKRISDIDNEPVYTSPNKTPNQLTVPDDRQSKSDDSGYADQKRISDIDNEEEYKTNQELMRRISEMQAQLEALKLMATTSGKVDAEPETSSCTRSFEQYYTKSDEDQENSGQNTPRQAQVSIAEPVSRASKEVVGELQRRKERLSSEKIKSKLKTENRNSNDINIPSKDYGHSYTEKYETDDAVLNLTRRESNVPKKQSVNTNNTIIEKKKLTSGKNELNANAKPYTNEYIAKEDDSKRISTKEMDDRRDDSISLQHVADHLKIQPRDNFSKEKPKDIDNDNITEETPKYVDINNVTQEKPKDVENMPAETSAVKRKRVSLVIFENGGDNRVSSEIEPKTPTESVQNESINIKSPGQTTEPSTLKSDDVRPTKLPLPVLSNITEKRSSMSNKKVEDGKNILKTSDSFDGDVKTNQDETNNVNNQDKTYSVSQNVNMKNDKALILKLDKPRDSLQDKELVIEVQNPERFRNDNIRGSLIPMQSEDKYSAAAVQTNAMTDYKAAKDILKSGSYENDKVQFDNNTEIGGIVRVNEFNICQHHATICTCPEKPSPSLTLLRSCSGSQMLATLPPGGGFRRCACSERAVRYSCGFNLKDRPMSTSTPKHERAPTPPASPHTYTVDSGDSRADSPAGTDHEISVMTDLPSEKDNEQLSLGEQRPTSVSVETCSLRYKYSDGEVPTPYQQDTSSKSLGEVGRSYEKKPSYGENKSPAEQMEATLHAISQELDRCRSLLQSQRPAEVMYRHT